MRRKTRSALAIAFWVIQVVQNDTYAQIAQWSRAGHKTQGMGKWLDPAADARQDAEHDRAGRAEPGLERAFHVESGRVL